MSIHTETEIPSIEVVQHVFTKERDLSIGKLSIELVLFTRVT